MPMWLAPTPAAQQSYVDMETSFVLNSFEGRIRGSAGNRREARSRSSRRRARRGAKECEAGASEADTIDYPWLKPGWVEAPVRPFERK
jgi:hypothetical protein